MDHFQYQDQNLYAEGVKVADIVQRWGTPCYIYSRATLERHWRVYSEALQQQPHLICYAVKANSNIAILNLLARLGSGFAIVSGGELARVLAAGGDPSKIVFSGVGKSEAEIEQAIRAQILCFNVESFPELERINAVAAKLQQQAPVTIRVNPDIDVNTHPYISTGLKENKFGIAYDEALLAYQTAQSLPHLRIVGLACHIGSQILELAPFLATVDRMIALEQQLKQAGFNMQHFDLGGGLGVRYHDENPPAPEEFVNALRAHLSDRTLNLIVEPGRVIAANAGILVTRIEYLKLTEHKNFAIVDAGMNDLIRPALYEAWHQIIPVSLKSEAPVRSYDIVGPVCESADFLGKQRQLQISSQDLLAVRGAGAYGAIMSSNYNTRARAAEVLVDGDQAYLIRERETVSDLFEMERKIEDANSLY